MMLSNRDGMSVFSKFLVSSIFLVMISTDALAKEVIGWVENVQITPGNVLITAKIDTGADSSSLHCDCIEKFMHNGEQWVRFTLTDTSGKQVSLEKKIERSIKIKRHFGDVQVRDVVRLGLCLGGQYEERNVSLVDRSGFKYDMLIGRKYLKDKFIIDPSQQFLVEPHCDDFEK